MSRLLTHLMVTVIVFTPYLVVAAGLVPCGGTGEPACQACHVKLLAQNMMDWLVAIFGFIAVLTIVVAGLYMAASRGNPSAATWAKTRIFNVIIGYIILLASWMLIDMLLKLGMTDSAFGVWNDIVCVAPPTPKP